MNAQVSRLLALARAALFALLDLVLPMSCAGCGDGGATWCAACRTETASLAYPGGARAVRPDPCPAGLPPVVAWSPYAGALRSALVAYKDRERRDLAPVLAAHLAVPLGVVLRALVAHTRRDRGATPVPMTAAPPVLVVPIPSSAAAVRRRGDRPLEALARRAVRELDPPGLPARAGGSPEAVSGRSAGVEVARALRIRRRVADQAGLDLVGRADNVRDAMVVRRRWEGAVAGARCVLVDDVMTTGATLAEAARALRRAGAVEVVAVTVAATERRSQDGRRMHRAGCPPDDAVLQEVGGPSDAGLSRTRAGPGRGVDGGPSHE